jgi:hypothetical protein
LQDNENSAVDAWDLMDDWVEEDHQTQDFSVRPEQMSSVLAVVRFICGLAPGAPEPVAR